MTTMTIEGTPVSLKLGKTIGNLLMQIGIDTVDELLAEYELNGLNSMKNIWGMGVKRLHAVATFCMCEKRDRARKTRIVKYVKKGVKVAEISKKMKISEDEVRRLARECPELILANLCFEDLQELKERIESKND